MASIIRIKRSSVSGNPSVLGAGELAYSNLTDNGSNGGDRLYIGMGSETNGNAANHIVIGGKYFTDRLNQTAGVLTAGAAIVVDGDKKIDDFYVDNLRLNGSTISSTNADGNIYLDPDGAGYVQILGTNALIIPKGTSAQQAPAISGAIRFNTDDTAFEGYDGTAWASLGGVKSVDQLTYIKAEATPGAGDGTLYFNAKDGTSSVNVLTLDKDGLKIVAETTASGSNTGALQVAGGVSIEGALYLNGTFVQLGGSQSSDQFLAKTGTPDENNGFSFQNDGGADTGMFSLGDGNLQFYSNNDLILELDGTNEAVLYTPTLQFNNSQAAQITWDPTGDAGGLKFYTRYGDQQTISSVNDGDYVLIQSTNNAGDSNAGRSSLRWHDYDVSAYSQVDAQSDGVWIKNAAWNGSSLAQYWHFGLDGKITLPNVNDTGSQYAAYTQVWGENNNTFVIQPNSDANDATLRIGNWDNSSAINIWNSSSTGITLGNYDNGDSYIDIGGADGSMMNSSDDVTIRAQRSGKLYLEANNNDIELNTDSGTVTFRNSDGHLVVPGVVETYDTTGDVTLAASDGTERNMVFNGQGWLTLPNVGTQWYDSNNINGTRVAEMGFDGELYISNYNDQISFYANDNSRWQFTDNNNGEMILPNGAILSDGSSNSILLGNGVDPVGYSQRISIGYQPDGQDGQSWDTIAIGARAGTTNQGNNSIALGNRAGNLNQGQDSIAIGGSPNSGVGGAGYSNQGQYAVAIGGQAGELYQGNDSIALGFLAGNDNQGYGSQAIGYGAGTTCQGYLSVAIGQNAGNSIQGHSSVALGHTAGRNSQGNDAVAIGVAAGQDNQGQYSVAIGERAGYGDLSGQGQYSVAIGARAGYSSQHEYSIAINASGSELNPSEAGLYINPIRQVTGTQYLTYNSDTKEVVYNTSTLQVSGDTISSTATNGNIIIEPNGTGHVSVSNAQIKNVAEPTDDTDAATKYYVDAARSGLDVKLSVKAATTEAITLNDTQIIDDVTVNAGDRVLVKDQAQAKYNGIYVVVAGGDWTRATDMDSPGEVSGGTFTFVEQGTVNGDSGFVVTSNGSLTIGTDAIVWTLFSASGTLIAGDGLSKDGYTLKVNVESTGGLEINSDNLRLKSTVAGNGLSLTSGVLDVGGTADRITVGSNSVDIASTYVGQTSITTLGTITSGTWNGTSIADSYIDDDLTINGGTIDDTPIGDTTRNTAKFTTLAANSTVTFTDTTDAGPLGTAAVVLDGGLSVAKKIYVGTDLIGAGADTSTLSGFDIDGGTY